MEQSYLLKPNVAVNADVVYKTATGVGYLQVQSGGNGVILAILPACDGIITVYPGDGIFAGKELVFDVYENQMHFVHLETGPYLITEGKNRGCICVEGDCDADVCLIELV